MPKRRTLRLTDEQRSELLNCRDRHKRPYMRERAAALLFIAAGMAPVVVAREHLWRSRDPDTLYSWLNRDLAHGLAGLLITAGRGRKPAFSPSLPHGRRGQRSADASDETRPTPVGS